MGLINFKEKSGAFISINTSNIVFIEKKENYIIISFNVNNVVGCCGFLSSKMHTAKYEYRSADDAEEAYKYMCSKF
jgi:hypothetical protein